MKWIRLWVDEVVKGTTFDELNLAERGLWWSLLLLAGQSLNPGIVEIRKGVKYTEETLASVVNCDPKSMRKYLKKLISVGKIDRLEDGRLQIINWQRYQTRYEKYYKKENEEPKNDGTQNGIDMPGRKEEEVDKKNKDIQAALVFPLRDNKEFELSLAKISQYEKTYRNIDVPQELKECVQWNIDNESNRKTAQGILRHINRWLAKASRQAGPQLTGGIERDSKAVDEARKEVESTTPEQRASNRAKIQDLARKVVGDE